MNKNDDEKKSFNSMYAVMRSIAERLKKGGPADIDGLVENFREAREAYAFCRQRLDAVQAEIEAEINRTDRR